MTIIQRDCLRSMFSYTLLHKIIRILFFQVFCLYVNPKKLETELTRVMDSTKTRAHVKLYFIHEKGRNFQLLESLSQVVQDSEQQCWR